MEAMVYKQKCKACEMNYYVEDLKVIGASSCPKCGGKGVHISEHKTKLERRWDDAIDALMYAFPVRGRTPEEMNKCIHIYKELETDIKNVYADKGLHAITGHALFYCEKCLDIQKKDIHF